MEIAIERVGAPTEDARRLIAELDEVLGAVYPPEQRHGLSLDQVFEPHVRFFIARLGDAAVGCGALALFRGYAEVKRMYTRAVARGQGVGTALLARLEAEARGAGETALRLETGIAQVAAIGLYEGFGFRRCAAFGHYATLPPHRIAGSIFYEKPR
ncbi:MAG TPA: GNAT family N-acetyltransferase [Stellaceae bacterium]|nr:GNAT family N-acetyltransferase [Stellaceae bacterium]